MRRQVLVLFGAALLGSSLLAAPGCKNRGAAARTPEVGRRVSEHPADVEVHAYREEYSFEADGTFVRTTSQRYEVLTQAGVENWSYTGAAYSPWYMERPVLTARVISPGGQVTELDPATIAESAAFPSAPDIYSDSRILRAPLPNVTVGTVVEESVTIRTTRPFFGGGTAHSMVFQSGIPRKEVELVIDVPADAPLAFEIRDADVETKDQTADGRRRVVIRGGPYPALEAPEAYLPSDVPVWPEVVFSTAEAWQPMARAYSKIVDEKLADFVVPTGAEALVQARGPAREKATALLEWMRGSIRYTGIEFGESAIVPNPPADTLGRGYGDCKDQALLLVGLLRKGGVDAKVALLNAGNGADVREKLPGLNVFNHAIVYVPGKEPFWVDPTSDYTRAGELPIPDQDRFALVVDPGTKALTRTPTAAADANVYRERREVWLGEFEEARIVESATATGAIERQLRGNFRAGEKDLRDGLTKYIESTYNAGELGELENSGVTDLSRPFEFKIEAKKAKIGFTNMFAADLILGYGPIFDWLPDGVWTEEPRRSDLVLPVAYKASTHYSVHAPPGFVPRDPPRFAEVDAAPLRVTRTASTGEDDVLSVELSLEIPRRHLTPEEVEHVKKGLGKLAGEKEMRVHFVHLGSKLIEDRKLREGVDVFRDLANKNPKNAGHSMRYAQALLELGFGDAARRVAARAVQIEPKNAPLVRMHATLLSHDLLGRHLESGWDRDGAIAAYARARKLDPEDVGSVVQTAVLMEHDENGERYRLGFDLSKIVDLYDSVDPEKLAAYENGGFVNNVLFALLWAERWDELQTRLRKMSFDEKPAVVAIVTAAATGGPAEGVSESARLDLRGATRVQALVGAAETLVSLRLYPEAAALYDSASTDSERAVDMQARARTVRKIHRIDPDKLPMAKPGDVVTKALALVIATEKIEKNTLRPLFAERLRGAEEEADISELSGVDVKGTRLRQVLVDTVASSLAVKSEGDDKGGHRIKARADFGGRDVDFTAYVVKERGGYKIRAWENQPAELGKEALYWLEHKEPARAKRWLDWASDMYDKPEGSDPLGPGLYRRIWKDGKGDARLSAAALAANGSKPERAIRILEDARKAETDRNQRAVLERALVSAYDTKEDWDKALGVARAIQKDFPNSDRARDLELAVLGSAGRWKDYGARVNAALGKDPKDTRFRALQILVEMRTGNFEKARKLGDAMIADERVTSGFYNEQAWLALFMPEVREKDLEYALKSVQMDPNGSNLHTLACVQIERGRLSDAWHTLDKLLASRGEEGPEDEDYYVIGRLAEALGLPVEAKAAYKRVEAPKTKTPTSTFVLAKRGLDRVRRK